MSIITCCKGCVAPKRYPGCHSHCEEYIEQKQEWNKVKAIADRKKMVESGLDSQKMNRISKAEKKRRKL